MEVSGTACCASRPGKGRPAEKGFRCVAQIRKTWGSATTAHAAQTGGVPPQVLYRTLYRFLTSTISFSRAISPSIEYMPSMMMTWQVEYSSGRMQKHVMELVWSKQAELQECPSKGQ